MRNKHNVLLCNMDFSDVATKVLLLPPELVFYVYLSPWMMGTSILFIILIVDILAPVVSARYNLLKYSEKIINIILNTIGYKYIEVILFSDPADNDDPTWIRWVLVFCVMWRISLLHIFYYNWVYVLLAIIII